MSTSVAETAGEPSLRFHLVHAVRGRTRMRVTPPHLAGDLARAFERLLRDHPGVRDVHGNPDSGSIVVTYDPDVLDIDRLFEPASEIARASRVEPIAQLRAIVDGWAEAVLDAQAAVVARGETLWKAARDQISAAMNFWSASSVVARSSTLLQAVSSGALFATGATSRR